MYNILNLIVEKIYIFFYYKKNKYYNYKYKNYFK